MCVKKWDMEHYSFPKGDENWVRQIHTRLWDSDKIVKGHTLLSVKESKPEKGVRRGLMQYWCAVLWHTDVCVYIYIFKRTYTVIGRGGGAVHACTRSEQIWDKKKMGEGVCNKNTKNMWPRGWKNPWKPQNLLGTLNMKWPSAILLQSALGWEWGG